jgi:hypothetical protein
MAQGVHKPRQSPGIVPPRSASNPEDHRVKARKPVPNRLRGRIGVVALCLLALPLIGGCTKFRNGIADALETATRGLLLDTDEPTVVIDTARDSVVTAALTLFFDQLREDEFSR